MKFSTNRPCIFGYIFAVMYFVSLSGIQASAVPAESTPAAPLNSNAASDGNASDWDVQLTTNNTGTWIAVWDSVASLGDTIGGDIDILYAVSTNNGTSWSAPSALNSNADTDSGADYYPQLTTNGSGTWIAVWESDDSLGGTIGDDYDILYAVSTDDGASWSPPAPLNSNASTDVGDDYYSQLTTNGAGTWIAVWESGDTLLGTIGDDYDILYAVSENDGTSWTEPAALNSNASSDIGDEYHVRLTTDSSGTWIATWGSDENLGSAIGTDWDILYAVSENDGMSWTAPAALNSNATTDSGGDYDQQLATDGLGNWIVIWFSSDTLGSTIGTDFDILYAVSTNNGTNWSAPAALNSNASTDTATDASPELTTDESGTWIAVWRSSDSLGSTIGTDTDILYAESTNNGATWSPIAALSSNADTDIGSDSTPQVATDGAGMWIAAWITDDDLGATIGFDNDILYTAWDTSGSANSEIWVDLSAMSDGDGTQGSPYNNFDSAVTNVAIGGIVHVVGGLIDTPYTFSKEMYLYN